MGHISLTDGIALIALGYKVDELKNVKNLVSDKDDDTTGNIIELAKKVSYAELETALSIFGNEDKLTSEPSGTDINKPATSEDTLAKEPKTDEHKTSSADSKKADDIDYKKLYEKEKKLREDLQKAEQKKDLSGSDEKTDEDLLLEITQDILN